jgi:hypothetical protein
MFMRRALLLIVLLAGVPAAAQLRLEVEPDHGTVGDALTVRLTIQAEAGREPARAKLGPDLGKFTVLEESWSPLAPEDGEGWVWAATVAAYETGDLEFPSLRVAPASGNGEGWASESVTIEIASVIDEDENAAGEPELADLKDPASLAPDFAPVWLAAVLFAIFVALSALGWWLYRRYAARLAAAPAVEDPFARTPPHEWAFGALRELLDQRSDYSTDRFYARLSWILKRYLGGRYRIDLLEHTTDEARPLLEQAGTPGTAVAKIRSVLNECDAVKFARHRPTEGERKDVVERVYGIVDQTKPVEVAGEASQGAA